MGRPRKPWTETVEEAGQRVRLYERGRRIYREVRTAGGKDRLSLGHGDRVLAVQQAGDLCRQLASLLFTGQGARSLTVAELFQHYQRERGPLLSATRRQFVASTAFMFTKHLGADFPVEDFGQHHADGYVKARRDGQIRAAGKGSVAHPRDGTIRGELQQFSVTCNWACGYRTGGRRMLAFNPVRGLRTPVETNPRRPVASASRYQALLAVAGTVEGGGWLELLLQLAWHTGRRVNAILHLRRSDLLLSPDDVRRALAAAGADERYADAWPAAICWRAEHDKCGYLTHSPMTRNVRNAVDAYLRTHPMVGEAWLFPAPRDASHPVTKVQAGYYLRVAEERAGLPHLAGGGWHAFRRGWATARRALPVQDVMAAGGWRDVKALQTAYQHADAATIARVMEG